MKTLLTVAFVILLASDVRAACWQSKSFEEMAREKWAELPAGHGVTQGGELVRVYVNPKTGRWTITIVHGDRRECPLSAGEEWRQITQGDPA